RDLRPDGRVTPGRLRRPFVTGRSWTSFSARSSPPRGCTLGAVPTPPGRYLSLATFRKNGAEVRTPVWFASMNDKLYVFTAGNAGKVKRLRRSPRARIAPSDARGRVRGPWQDATARVITDAHLVAS